MNLFYSKEAHEMKTLYSRKHYIQEQPCFNGTIQLKLSFYKYDGPTICSILDMSMYFLHFIKILFCILKL